MPNNRFYDQILALIQKGDAAGGMPLLTGHLAAANHDPTVMRMCREALRSHDLHQLLLEDPHTNRAFTRPRGYPGDAELIDYYYDRRVPPGTSDRGAELFAVSSAFQTAQAVRARRTSGADLLEHAWASGKRICALACGHFREADALVGKDMGNIIAVDQDGLSLDYVRSRHGSSAALVEANVLQYLRGASARGERFDLIYALGLTDYLDDRAMHLLHRLMRNCLAPRGRIVLANFVPHHLSAGWLDACMDWHLVYRDEADLRRHAAKAGLQARTFPDETGCIAWCEMWE